MPYGKHPYYSTPREKHRAAFNDEIEASVLSGTRKVPQHGVADGDTRKDRETIGSYQIWRT
jgi:hypothetical protein